jgi:hypothetical protein
MRSWRAGRLSWRRRASGAQQAQRGHEAELQARLAALQAEVQYLLQPMQ